MKSSVHCKELSRHVCGFCLWPAYYSCRSSWWSPGVGVDTPYFVFPINWLLRTCLTFCRFFGVAAFFKTSLWLTFACGMPSKCRGQLIYGPLVGLCPELSRPFLSLLPSDDTSLPLMKCWFLCYISSGVDQWVGVLLTQLNVIHVEEVADGCSIT